MESNNVKLSPPWITFANEVTAMFESDPDIAKIDYNDDAKTLKLFVDDSDKADALFKILPESKSFGNVTVTIEVVPSNAEGDTIDKTFEKAFRGNPVMSRVLGCQTPFGDVCYVLFAKKVAQFYNDQMEDPSGNKSVLFQDIAKNIFREDLNVFYSTDTY